MAKHSLYLTTVSGQGDTFIHLIDKESWDWMHSPFKPCPQAILDRYMEANDEPGWTPNITSGSAVNDAALQIPAVKVDGEDAEFFSIKEVLAFVREHDIEIIDEWDGCIY